MINIANGRSRKMNRSVGVAHPASRASFLSFVTGDEMYRKKRLCLQGGCCQVSLNTIIQNLI